MLCRDLAPTLFTLRQAQGERLAYAGLGPRVSCTRHSARLRRQCFLAPYARPSPARLRANGSATCQGPCACAVDLSTGSGRTAVLCRELAPTLFTLRQAQGERLACLPGPFLAPLAFRLGSGGTAVLCRELAPTLFTLRQAQGERHATCQGPLLAPLTLWLGSGRTVMCCRQRGSLASPNRTVKLRAMGLLECPVTPMLPCAACRACVAPGPVPRPKAVGSNCVRR